MPDIRVRRLLIYAILFPPIVWLFMCAVNRVSPFEGSWFTFFSSLAVAYVLGIVPALLTGLAHNMFKERGYRSILSMLVAFITMPLMSTMLIDGYRQGSAYAVAGLVAAMCCWTLSRIGQQPCGWLSRRASSADPEVGPRRPSRG